MIPLDLESLRRQYPDMPGWGERVFLELESIKSKMGDLKGWTAQDIVIVCTAVTGVIAALKAGGAV